ncbi:MAG: hypothetical protein ABSH13_23500 [Candidatus Acidiferrum sp.]|jgi:hypothetical protein
MERKEYLLSELPAELRAEVEFATFGMGMDILNVVGFTRDGVRYRIYRDERIKAAAKTSGLVDLQDALKGADVPTKDVEAVMGKLGFDVEKRRKYWTEIAERQAAETPSSARTEGIREGSLGSGSPNRSGVRQGASPK